jgi:hypothetical protein
MNPTRILTATLLVSASALALHSAGELRWEPAQGATLRRELITKQILATESMTFREGSQQMVSQRIFDLVTTTTVRTSDQLREVEPGRPRVLRRFYDEARLEARAEVSGGQQQTRGVDFNGKSAFQGKSVVFTWVPEDAEYGRYYDGLEGFEERLADLDEDLGARALLSPEAMAEGSEWELPASALRGLFGAGGDLAYEFEAVKDPLISRSINMGVGANLSRAFGGEESGVVKVRWARSEELEGHSLAVLELEFDVKLSRELRDLANELRAVNERASGQEATSALLEIALDGGGVVRWDLTAGCLFDTQDLRADQRLTFTKKVAWEQDGTRRENEQQLVMTGAILQESKVTVER